MIPVRSGNGALEFMENEGFFHEPKISLLEETLDYGIALKQSNVFADLWDLERFASCSECLPYRKQRMDQINISQQATPKSPV